MQVMKGRSGFREFCTGNILKKRILIGSFVLLLSMAVAFPDAGGKYPAQGIRAHLLSLHPQRFKIVFRWFSFQQVLQSWSTFFWIGRSDL